MIESSEFRSILSGDLLDLLSSDVENFFHVKVAVYRYACTQGHLLGSQCQIMGAYGGTI
jgi:hypothetical protein